MLIVHVRQLEAAYHGIAAHHRRKVWIMVREEPVESWRRVSVC